MHSDILEIMGISAELSSEPRNGIRPDYIHLWFDVASRHGFLFFSRCDLTRKYLFDALHFIVLYNMNTKSVIE